jgi:hypothetical protein
LRRISMGGSTTKPPPPTCSGTGCKASFYYGLEKADLEGLSALKHGFGIYYGIFNLYAQVREGVEVCVATAPTIFAWTPGSTGVWACGFIEWLHDLTGMAPSPDYKTTWDEDPKKRKYRPQLAIIEQLEGMDDDGKLRGRASKDEGGEITISPRDEER